MWTNFTAISYRSRIKRHARFLPSISLPHDRIILKGLMQEGVAVTSLEKLNMPSAQDIFQEARSLIPNIIHQGTYRKSYNSEATPEQLMEKYKLILWGLEERFLDIIENYLGVPVSYRGLAFRCDEADSRHVETRLWHKDAEDYRITKIIVYLNDVDTNGGPFTYIPKHRALDVSQLRFTNKRVLDDDMKKVVPESQWVECKGPAGTVVFADPCSIFHKGKTPTKQERFTLFYAYNSHHPLRPKYCKTLFSKGELLKRVPDLSKRQKECIAE